MPQLVALDPATYRRHAIHGEGRQWAETNCYTDVLVEVLHGLGHEPTALLAFTLATDWEVGQFTFFKPPPEDVALLFGLAVCEFAPWRPLLETVVEQIAGGRPVLVELDSYFLPDTEGTAYRRAHVKSTAGINRVDLDARVLGYWHNQGYWELGGEDFEAVFQTGGLVHPRMLPPYLEFLKPVPGRAPLRDAALVEGALDRLQAHLRVLPSNPFPRFRADIERDHHFLLEGDLEVFHAWSFVTLRQAGANYELAESFLRWLASRGADVPAAAAPALAAISTGAKALQFQVARSVARRRPLDLGPVDELARRWDEAMSPLQDRFR